MALDNVGENIEKAAEGLDKVTTTANTQRWAFVFVVMIIIFGIAVAIIVGSKNSEVHTWQNSSDTFKRADSLKGLQLQDCNDDKENLLLEIADMAHDKDSTLHRKTKPYINQ